MTIYHVGRLFTRRLSLIYMSLYLRKNYVIQRCYILTIFSRSKIIPNNRRRDGKNMQFIFVEWFCSDIIGREGRGGVSSRAQLSFETQTSLDQGREVKTII